MSYVSQSSLSHTIAAVEIHYMGILETTRAQINIGHPRLYAVIIVNSSSKI